MNKRIFLSLLCVCLVLTLLPEKSRAAETPIIGSVDGTATHTTWGIAGKRITIAGWAKNLDDTPHSIEVVVTSPTLGNIVIDRFWAVVPRVDVANFYGGTPHAGFNWVVPARFYTGTPYTFQFYGITDSEQNLFQHPFGSIQVTPPDAGLEGSVDRLSGNSIAGWAIDLDGDNLSTQKTAVTLMIDGEQAGIGLTGVERSDVMTYLTNKGYGPVGLNHGYAFTFETPNKYRDGQRHLFQAYALEFTEGTNTPISPVLSYNIETDGTVHN